MNVKVLICSLVHIERLESKLPPPFRCQSQLHWHESQQMSPKKTEEFRREGSGSRDKRRRDVYRQSTSGGDDERQTRPRSRPAPNQTAAPVLFRPDEDAVWRRGNWRATVGGSLITGGYFMTQTSTASSPGPDAF